MRIGGFYAEMSYVGSIGHLMAGSGFSEHLKRVYAPAAVSHCSSRNVFKQAKRVQIHTIPPTSATANFHSMRTYLQVQTWLNDSNLNPCEWE